MSGGSPREKPTAGSPRTAEAETLIQRLHAGEAVEESFAGIFRLYYDPIFWFFKSRGFDLEESRDLTQEVFLRTHQSLALLENVERFEGWLFQIATNIWKNELRRRSTQSRDAREVPLDASAGEARSLVEVVEAPVGPDRDPLSQTLEAERRLLLRRAFQDLPDRMRSCMMLRVDHGMKYEEIAEAMRISVQTVRKQLFEGRARLKRSLAPEPKGESCHG